MTTSAAGTANYVIYDENLSAGVISIYAAPTDLQNLQVSKSASTVAKPSSEAAN